MKAIGKFLEENGLNQYLTKRYLDYALAAFAILLGSYLKWEVQNILFFSFFVWIILNPISSRFFAKIALCFLVFVPLLLVLKRGDRAEQVAIFAYYFLILMVVTAIIEFKKKRI